MSRGSAGFFMRMRCGKTLACIDTINGLRAHPALIIAPVSVLASWENELIGEGVPRSYIIKIRAKSGKKPHQIQRQLLNPAGRYFLINFEMVKRVDALGIRRRVLPGLGLQDWRTIAVDESYRIANYEGKLWEYLSRFPAAPGSQYRYLLSGAPASEHPLDFASQMIFMDGEYFGCRTVSDYLSRFWRWNEYTYKYDVLQPGHLADILAHIQKSAFCTTLEDLGLGGKKLYRIDRVELNQAQKDLLQWLKTATVYIKKDGTTGILDPLVRCMFEAKISSGIHPLTNETVSVEKVTAAVQIWVDRPEPTLVLSRFVGPLFSAVPAYIAAGARVGLITGDTAPAAREALRQQFQAGTIDVIIAQVVPVKMGLDFSRLNRIVYLSNSFSQDDRAQSEDRGQHVGRTEPYEIIDIVSNDTHDLILTNVLTIKKENAILYTRAWAREIVNREERAIYAGL